MQGTASAPVPTTPTVLVLEIVGHEFAPMPPPSPPTDVWTIVALLVRLRWTDRSADEAGFNVYQSTADGPYPLVTTVLTNTTATANLHLSAGALYRFRVTAFSAAGESQPATLVAWTCGLEPASTQLTFLIPRDFRPWTP